MMRAEGSVATMWAEGQLGRRSAPEAAQLIFGQVREDPTAELLVLQPLGPGRRVFCIASGGCTAFALLSAQPATVVACDINPAQIALMELKKAVLRQTTSLAARQQAFWQDARPALAAVEPLLSEAARQFWLQNRPRLRWGLQNAGLVDGYLRRAVQLFHLVVHRRSTTRRLLRFTDVAAQREYGQRRWQSWRWQVCFWLLDARWLLRLGYGRAVLRRLPPNFAALVREQVERPLRKHPAAANPYLWHFWLPDDPMRLLAAPRCSPYFCRLRRCLRCGTRSRNCTLSSATRWRCWRRRPSRLISWCYPTFWNWPNLP
jgi:S-adenosylmethionine:diacylglycerol 3-amino-3-carboxypropyl transferase